MLIRLLTAAIFLFLSSCYVSRQNLSVIQKPIIYNQERAALSLAYMQEHYGMMPEQPVIEPKMIVVHWTGIPTLEGSFEAFYPPRLPGSRTDIKSAGALNVSVPYLIDYDGQIYQLMPDTLFARHVIGLNYCAIGIENVGDGSQHQLTEAQLQSNIRLIKYLAKKYDINYVIGHHEYHQFIGHPLWKERDPEYLTMKYDPGDEFMRKIRAHLQELDLKPLPGNKQVPGKSKDSIRQGIRGKVIWLEGNMMPTIAEDTSTIKSREGKPIERTVYIYELTSREQAEEVESGFYTDIETELVKKVEAGEDGHFQAALEPGRYSLLVKEPKGLYANLYDGEGNINPVTVKKDSVSHVEIKVDYKAVY